MQSYIDLLKDELRYTKRRYKKAGERNKKLLGKWIKQIERDIQRNSMKNGV